MKTLNEKLVSWLLKQNIQFSDGDFVTGKEGASDEQILSWDEAKLGIRPTNLELQTIAGLLENEEKREAAKRLREANHA